MNYEYLVSIITPVYNGEKYLEQTMRAILCSSYKNIELIIVDDGSKDDSNKIYTKIAKQDKRVKVIKQKNQGIAAARNTGLEKAKGEFITFVDQDDYLHKNAVEQMISKICRDNSDLIISSWGALYENKVFPQCVIEENYYTGKQTITDHFIKPVILFTDHMEDAYIKEWVVLGCLFKKDIIDNCKLKFKKIVDYEDDLLFLIDYMCCIDNISTIHKILYLWRCNYSSESHSYKYISGFIEKKKEYQNYIKMIASSRGIPVEEFEKYRIDSSGLIVTAFMDSELCDTSKTLKKKKQEIEKIFLCNNFLEDMSLSKRKKTEREYLYYVLLRKKLYFLALIVGKFTLKIADSMFYKKKFIRNNYKISFYEVQK
ncbi:MAG: glycosyltransferase family 2 protein [Lachnospiraceae bacterium]|jgi:glycosyltransferase involved in cell wall biosynthesis|nr:glycosyltransferase family 2 protein [Lachnospiraceae bacterium]